MQSSFRNPCKFFNWYDPEFPSQIKIRSIAGFKIDSSCSRAGSTTTFQRPARVRLLVALAMIGFKHEMRFVHLNHLGHGAKTDDATKLLTLGREMPRRTHAHLQGVRFVSLRHGVAMRAEDLHEVRDHDPPTGVE
ncbi:hypothetical protein H5410_064927 [Solanum commersonii]|uniref:Uncharacterized protein n=1 Tax=Solanum commersonii TaxID=4109 RepID=A0A9J5VYA3_SOLCO|nr:hypothetical protein H5410_064927 [Solanum commersonii]